MDANKTEPTDYLGIMSAESRNLREMSGELNSLAISFCETGNTIIGNKLFDIAFKISQSETKINKAVGDKINADWEQSQESSANVLNAALAGIMLQKG